MEGASLEDASLRGAPFNTFVPDSAHRLLSALAKFLPAGGPQRMRACPSRAGCKSTSTRRRVPLAYLCAACSGAQAAPSLAKPTRSTGHVGTGGGPWTPHARFAGTATPILAGYGRFMLVIRSTNSAGGSVRRGL